MRRIIAVAGRKGGTGKTTTAVNLGATIARDRAERVLLLDLDSQGSASKALGRTGTGAELRVALSQEEELPTWPTAVERLFLSPAGIALADEQDLAPDCVIGSLDATRLPPWTTAVIDCPPSLSGLALAAMLAAHHVVAPTQCTPADLDGVQELVRMLHRLRPGLPLIVQPSRSHTRRLIHREALEALHTAFPGRVAPAVREGVAAAEAHGHGTPLVDYAPRSAVAKDMHAACLWLNDATRKGRDG